MTQKEKRTFLIVMIAVFLVGLAFLLYIPLTEYQSTYRQTEVFLEYTETVNGINTEVYSDMWAQALAYNEALASRPQSVFLSEEELQEYEKCLDLNGSTLMGYVDIPELDCYLPIFRGDAGGEGVQHLEWTSLPVGGENSHCVIVGHRGIPGKTLFTDLAKMDIGDVFVLHVLGSELTYEVDQILVVAPHETEALQIAESEDYCTLLTCTPYGVNTHRLLVRGHRVDTSAIAAETVITDDAERTDMLLAAVILAAPIVLLWVVLLGFRREKREE